jgi:hypothetical protein
MHEREWVTELICVQATGLPSGADHRKHLSEFRGNGVAGVERVF